MNTPRKFYDRVLDEVCERLLHEIPQSYTYHSLRHTLDVVEQSILIARGERLEERDIDILKIAALFHDIGYVRARRDHEVISVEIFRKYGQEYGLPDDIQDTVCGCILSTKIPQQPVTLLEKILCDADLDYLGREDFGEISEMLFGEMLSCNEIPNREEWDQLQVRFLSQVNYHTEYSRKTRSGQLHRNLEAVKRTQLS